MESALWVRRECIGGPRCGDVLRVNRETAKRGVRVPLPASEALPLVEEPRLLTPSRQRYGVYVLRARRFPRGVCEFLAWVGEFDITAARSGRDW